MALHAAFVLLKLKHSRAKSKSKKQEYILLDSQIVMI